MTEKAKRGFLMVRRAGGQVQEMKSGLPFKDGGNRQEAEIVIDVTGHLPLAGVESCPKWSPHGHRLLSISGLAALLALWGQEGDPR